MLNPFETQLKSHDAENLESVSCADLDFQIKDLLEVESSREQKFSNASET